MAYVRSNDIEKTEKLEAFYRIYFVLARLVDLIKLYLPHILRLAKLQEHYLLNNLASYQHGESDFMNMFPFRKRT